MTISTLRPASTKVSAQFAAAETERRKNRLMGVLSKGLPTLPTYVLDLNVLLAQPSVDLKKVGNVLRTDPSLTAQVLRLCNSALFGLRHRVVSVEQAAILVGTERLRTLVLTCSLMQFAGKRLPKEQLNIFWRHSFLCALLAERLASQLHYCEKEQAYLGGLLHDIGQLPMWILVLGEQQATRTPPPPDWVDNVPVERDYFGMDHTKVGRWMGVSWNYMPSFVDVFEHHHTPERAQHDPYLVGIVAAADQFLIRQAMATEAQLPKMELIGSDGEAVDSLKISDRLPLSPPSPREHSKLPASTIEPMHPAVSSSPSAFLERCLPELVESEREAVLQMLQTEHLHLLPLVELGMSAAVGD
jgi:HD-like signal output (HDOD) protein